MRAFSGYRRQTGATLVVGLVVLLLFTLLVSSAFVLGTSNLKAVSNMQSRDESIAAANLATNLILSTPFTASPSGQRVEIDLNDDDKTDYRVDIAEPECVRVSPAAATAPSSVTLPAMADFTWNTVWEIRASVNDPLSGADTLVRSGVRVLLSRAEKDKVCPRGKFPKPQMKSAA
ncbi:hypothetical protein [Azorhizophilus paspali]|uniref:Type 4 fimbrial biogenesis protein PilX N-terminal domain-containing protein n=1 Tax=Azorhizophilus paspali TaxID=69963 RepID=A0ABV6SK06_AZOPA